MLDFINNHLEEIYVNLGFLIFIAWLFYRTGRIKTYEQMNEYMEKRAISKNKNWLTLKDFILG